MNRINLIRVSILLLTIFFGVSLANADDAKMSKKDRKKVEKILKGKQERVPLPSILTCDEAAMAFCYDVGKFSGEEYASMLAECEARVKENRLLLEYNNQMSDHNRNKYGEEFLNKIMKSASEEVERSEILVDYCNRERGIIAEAEARKMPEGTIIKVDYVEAGSARPTPVRIYMALGTDSRLHLIYSNEQFQDEKPVTVPNDVLQQLRSTFEENKLYRLHSLYSRPYGFSSIIEPLGGPPSCMLTVEFSDGTVISSRTNRMYFSEECRDFVGILRGFYWSKRKNDDNKIVTIK